MKATIVQNEIAVRHSIRPDVNREFLSWDISGWDDVKKVCKKVLEFDGRKFTFSCWNSDTNKIYFSRILQGNSAQTFAKII